ncbi:putative serine/threonine protein kinase [Minicystis rosea]|nr:putative serine/threonine protein kinase [Minicystis rosea]
MDEALAALEALREAETLWAAAPLDAARLASMGASLEQALEALRAQQGALPAPEEVAATRQTVEEIAASLGLGLEAPLPEALADVIAAPDGLERIRDGGLVAKRAEAALPAWVWRGLSAGPARVAAVASDPAFHDELVACLRWAEEPSLTSPGDLRDLADPGAGPLLERLRAAHEERTRTHERDERLALIAPITSEAVRAHLAADWPETEPEIAARERLLSSFASLEGTLGEQAREDLRARLATSSVEDGASALRKVERVRTRLGRVDNMPLEQIWAIAQLIPETVRPPTIVVPSFSFGPPLSSSPTGGTHHARGIFQPFESLQAYGTVSFPVRLTFDQALPAPIQVAIKSTRASGDFRTPAQLTAHEEIPPLDLPAGIAQHDFEIKIILSRTFAEDMAAGKRKNLEVIVEGTGPGGKSGKTTLTWTALAMETLPYRDPIPGTIQPGDVQQCPVGVESYLNALLTLVRQGESSFLVYGPRRFGKTSLLRAVQHFIDASDVVFLQPIGAATRPLPELWGDVAQRLQDRFRPAKVYGDLEGNLLPVEHAYDAIREEAAEHGVRAIYVVIDEAQAMFAHARREELAERLKERMENAWMATYRNGKLKRAAILFGFIGQAHLTRLLSKNLEASLKPYHRSEFTDEEILGLLRRTTVAGGLQSTREAREHLAKLAGNLFILNRLLSEIHAVCTDGRRTWFLRNDVDRASTKLAEDFRKGLGTTIWDWVRDPLNESDDLNTWRPSTAYPLALAWAGARARGEGGRAGALALLKRVCPEAEPLDERISEVLRELEGLGVLDRHEDFKLPMLERLLTIRAESPRPLDDAEREAAQRLGLLRVPRPEPEPNDGEAAMVHEGGQAKVRRGKWEGRTAAVRAISLSDKTRSRARFIHEVSLLRKISHASEQRVKVRLPHIFAMGIADDDPSTGLVIYEWIPGYPLPEASMTEAAVVEVGLQMADVLELLERVGIVHRDIRPANVLLRVPPEGHDMRVEIDIVLIDFGLARAVELLRGGERSIVEGVAAFIPPEVYGPNDCAAWSMAGDVYSTGVMLEQLLQRSAAADGAASSRQLRALIAELKAVNPGSRPTAAQLRARLHVVRKSLEGERKATGLEEIEKTLRSRIARLPEPMRSSALDHLHSLVFMHAGMLRDLRRHTAVGAILECAFRLVVKPRLSPRAPQPKSVYLRQASDLLRDARLVAPTWLDYRCTEATGLLRNAEHHPDDFVRIISQALGQLGSSYSAPNREEHLTEALDHVARLLDELTNSRDRLVATFVAEALGAGASGQALRVR